MRAGFGNWMADKIQLAGLPERCVTHGLRKAAARRLAEAGCTANEIGAITGHTTLKEISRYTRAAEQRGLHCGYQPTRETEIERRFPDLRMWVGTRGT